MLFFYDGNSKLSGIYEIRNRYTDRSYIGQASRFKERWLRHKKLFNLNHENIFFSRDYNKCKEILGHDNFLEFHILEIMENSSKEERNIREEYWIQEYENAGYKLYNFNKKVSQPEHVWSKNPEKSKKKLRIFNLGKKLSIETKKKISSSLKGRKCWLSGKQATENHKKNISQSLLGKKRKPFSKEHKLNMSLSQKGKFGKNKKIYKNLNLKSSTNEIITEINCLAQFCRENNLSCSALCQVLSGKRKQHKGWKLV